jgi:hypothetical protein
LVVAAALAALPCGYGFGVVAAFVLAGGADVGGTPLVTVPLALAMGAAVSLLPVLEAHTRFMIMGTAAITATVLFLMVRLAFP